jgi:hypothetical protein
MSTLPLRAQSTPQIRVPGLSRLGAFLMFVVDAYAEATQSMREAQKKYPYAGI